MTNKNYSLLAKQIMKNRFRNSAFERRQECQLFNFTLYYIVVNRGVQPVDLSLREGLDVKTQYSYKA